ncbi:MAG: N-acetyl-D-Glu racemase DgcA [Planctomycetota bacterium]
MLRLEANAVTFPLARTFSIARSSRDEQAVIQVEVSTDPHRGRGEGVPTRHYGESIESSLAQIDSVRDALVDVSNPRVALQELLPPGAARNAIDCALWDLEAKQRGLRAWELQGLAEPEPVLTVDTVVLSDLNSMAQAAARSFGEHPLLKVKLGRDEPFERMRAIRSAVPRARLVIDANEAWTFDQLAALAPRLADLEVEWLEQPLPAGEDHVLLDYACPIPLVADESLHTRKELPHCEGRYDAVNLKLDKTGGLTEALATMQEATRLGFDLMVGCMVCSSLSIAPAMMLTHRAELVDLDGPTWLQDDPKPNIRFERSKAHAPSRELWG